MLASSTGIYASAASENIVENQKPQVTTETAELDAAHQERMIKTAIFLSLAQKAKTGEIDVNYLVYYAIEWAQELAQSDDAADQELSQRLYAIVMDLTQQAEALSVHEEVEEVDSGE